MLPLESKYYFCEPSIPRAFKIDDLKPISMKYFSGANYFSDVKTALYKAQQNCIGDQFVFVGGSTFVVADALS
jgi:dihydrofolate synthase/folylpolyglutamate synthase